MLRFARYKKDVIMLDVVKDEFTIIKNNSAADEIFNSASEYLGLITKNNLENTGSYLICAKKNECSYGGFLEERWFTPQPDVKGLIKLDLLICIMELKFRIKEIESQGLIGVVAGLNKTRKKAKKRNVSIKELTEKYKAYLRIIFPLISKNSNCLSYSYFLADKLNQFFIPAVVVIGVRTQPFYSHAWVEVDGVIINDEPDLRERLSVILVV
ncbi:lasso peptide biosynthesis B2 protein (plasmid) [Klebsiella sp. B345]|uniref:lasso peptide biosynthesis B2 protein n=1 Tax=Klebsiella sp. B345 TaxID=2755398 RepID=UPI003DAA0AEA